MQIEDDMRAAGHAPNGTTEANRRLYDKARCEVRKRWAAEAGREEKDVKQAKTRQRQAHECSPLGQQVPTSAQRCFFCCSDDDESSECGDSEAEGRDQASPTDTGRGAASSEHESPSDDEEPPATSDGNGQNAELDTFGFGHDSDSNGEDDGKISEQKQTSSATPAAPPNAQMVVWMCTATSLMRDAPRSRASAILAPHSVTNQ